MGAAVHFVWWDPSGGGVRGDGRRLHESVGPLAEAVAERDAALAELARLRRRSVALSALAHRLATSESTSDLVQHLCASLTGLLDCDAAAVWLWNPELGEIRAAATAGLEPALHDALLSMPVRPDETPELAELLARREPLVLNRGAVTPILDQMLDALGLQAAIGVALLSGDRLLGAVTASWQGGSLQGAALDEAVQRLQGIADQGASALLKAELLDRARHLALHDGLTGLPNRLLFHRRLTQALQDSNGDAVVAVLFCDLDRFKHVNDELGHAVGDEVLRIVASRLVAVAPAASTVGRLSGDEFTVLLPDVEGARAAVEVGQSLVNALAEPLRVEGRPLHLTVSIGVASYRGPHGRPDLLLRSADAALYDAKRRGRNQVVLARAADRAPTGPAPSLAVELRRALEDEQLRLFLQPVMNLAPDHGPVTRDVDRGGQRLCGAEALVRWQHPRLGLLSPATFLPLAEDDGSVVSVDLWMLRQACRQASTWQQVDGVLPYIAVNVSVPTLLNDRIHESVRTALVEHGVPPSQLQVEVVESRALRDLPAVVERLTSLRHLGVRVALDDFGTGFSTLSWLQDLPVDVIKVDRSLTIDSARTDDHRRRRVANALLRAIVAVGAELGVDVVAEGVESPLQLEAVRAAGCNLVQGFLLGGPEPGEVLSSLLVSQASRR